MNLQQEASAHINKNREKFLRELLAALEPVEKLLTNKLHKTDEVANALEHLTEVDLWAKRASELWGLK